MAKPQSVFWIDMIANDPAQVSHFYSEVTGLTREAFPEDETHTSYTMRNVQGDEVLGICDAGVFPNWVSGWVPYIEIDDFDRRTALVESAGGQIIRRQTTDYQWKGQRFCLIRDPSGAPMMLCEKKPEEAAS